MRSKKSIVCALMLLFTTFSATYAQQAISSKIQAGINLEAALPFGDFSKAYSFGIGGSVMGRYALSGKAHLTASIGYLNFSGKSVSYTYYGEDEQQHTETDKVPATHGIPLRVGANYMLGNIFFIQGEIGESFMKGGSAFLYAPGIGARFRDDHLEVELKYEGWSKNGTLSFGGLRIGYFF